MVDPVKTDINFGLVTTGQIDGTGIFDLLMRTMNVHIKHEYDEQRIQGEDYATVYLGALQTAAQQAIQYVLQHELQEAQTDLVREQVDTECKQQEKLDKEIEVLSAQKQKLEDEARLLQWKKYTEEAQTRDRISNGQVMGAPQTRDSGGILGQQKDLLYTQIQGFKRDAEQRAAKIYADVWTVRHTQSNTTDAVESGFGANQSNLVLSALRKGIDNYDASL